MTKENGVRDAIYAPTLPGLGIPDDFPQPQIETSNGSLESRIDSDRCTGSLFANPTQTLYGLAFNISDTYSEQRPHAEQPEDRYTARLF